jgi:hypothetical protein
MSLCPTRKRIAAFGALFAVAAPALFAGNAEAYVCKTTYTTVHSSAIVKSISMAKARTLWSSTVVSKYGDIAWSVWDIAASKSQSCSFGSGKWTCTAKAKPCLYVVP